MGTQASPGGMFLKPKRTDHRVKPAFRGETAARSPSRMSWRAIPSRQRQLSKINKLAAKPPKILDTAWYSGIENYPGTEKLVRRALGTGVSKLV